MNLVCQKNSVTSVGQYVKVMSKDFCRQCRSVCQKTSVASVGQFVKVLSNDICGQCMSADSLVQCRSACQ